MPTIYRAIRAKVNRKNDCGFEWDNLPSGCPRCNPNGEHYHYANGSCDTEPCRKHGGPE